MELTERLQPLASMVGSWTCEETYHAGGWVPEEATAVGRDEITVGPGGNSILASYESDGAIGHYEAHDVIVGDPDGDDLRFFFVDSFAPVCQDQRGRVDGETAVFEHRTVVAERPGVFRRTYTLADDSQHLAVEFLADGADAPQPLVTIRKRRIG